MDHINCYITINAEEADLKNIQQYVGTPVDFIDELGTETQQRITSQQPHQPSPYLVWDRPESILLVNPSTSSTRYQFCNGKDKEALVYQLSTFNIAPSINTKQKTSLKKKAFYLDLPSLELNKTHLTVLREVIVDSIQDNCSLTVLLNTTDISTTQTQKAPWSIQTEKQWKKWQLLLGLLYMTQVQVSYSLDSPLFDMTVMVVPLLGDDYMVSMQPDFDTLFALDSDTHALDTWNTRRQAVCFAPLPIRTIASSLHDGINNGSDDNYDDNTVKDHQLQRFDTVVVGGTFDHLHAGHKILLTMTALSSTRAMVVGVTDDIMLQAKKHHEWIESTTQRIDHVRQFCKKIRPDLVYDVVPICDAYGPTITDPNIDALVCSQETLKGGHMVNDERQKRGFSILALRVIDVISATVDSTLGNEANLTDKISSSWIRNYLAEKEHK